MDNKPTRPKARLPRGFRDRSAPEIAAERACLETIARVYESYGFEPLETPAFEYTDALGKFLPDLDRPNEGVFSLQDDDGQWLSLRYDLTAPLARYVAENFQHLPKPFRRYQVGPVWRNEKPGPGRYREFTQFDADTVGSASPAADAELLMMVADTLDALGLAGQYVIKVNSRKILDGVLESCGLALDGSSEVRARRGIVSRAIDKLDRLGIDGVLALLGPGRKDESGAFTEGAGLDVQQIARVISFISEPPQDSTDNGLFKWWNRVAPEQGYGTIGMEGVEELRGIFDVLTAASYSDRIKLDSGVVRGLDYYTGPVFEAQLTFPVTNDAGETIVFGSVAGGGRYDDLVARFTGQQVPATGISIGVSRLLSALRSRSRPALPPLVVVLALDDPQSSFRIAAELRVAGIRAETYVGTRKFGDQLKYADKRGAAIAVIEGSDERANSKVTLKNLALGAELSKSVESRTDWVKDRSAQETVDRSELVAKVRAMLGAL